MSIVKAIDLDGRQEIHVSHVSTAYPLVLDLDGTLLQTDLLFETLIQFVKTQPLRLLLVLYWACHGLAYLKAQLGARVQLSVDLLPINEALVAYARAAAATGRTVIVATAANEAVARKICVRFDFVSDVLASTREINLKGRQKAAALARRFPDGYVYAGDAAADLPIWRQAHCAIFAGRDARLLRRLTDMTPIEAAFTQRRASLAQWARALRVHQWPKNGLLVLPLLLAGHALDLGDWIICVAGAVAMSLAASATYLLNDLMDLEHDRQHWSKRSRPLAAGAISIPQGTAAAVGLLIASLLMATLVGGLPILGLVGLYCLVTLSYSFYLKRVPLLDVTVLAALFTLRLAIGAALAEVRISAWLMVFSMFFFLSLALAKRSTEIGRKTAVSKMSTAPIHGRGYLAADAGMVSALGISSAVAAIVIMVLYLIHEAFSAGLYPQPQLLWGAPVTIGLWLGRIWILCGRGVLHDDPVTFAINDRVSLLLGLGVVCSFASAALFP